MSCHDARELFSGWVDEALTADERASVDAHLAECADCRKELERFEATLTLLHRVARPRAPVGFVDRVLDAARPVPWHRRLLRRLFLPLSVKLPAEAAAVLLMAGLAVYIFQRTPALQEATRQEAPAVRREAPPAAGPPLTSTLSRSDASRGAPGNRPAGAARPADKQRSTVPEERKLSATSEAPKPSPPPAAPAPAAAPSPSAEAPTAFKKEGAAQNLDAARATESEAPARPAPAVGGRSETTRDKTASESTPAPAMPQAAAPRSALRALPPADVMGRLAVKDRDAAERALGEALARAGGVVVSRREETGAIVVEVAVPAAAYSEFNQELTRIGAWRPEGQPAALPPSVRMTLRLVQ